MPTGAAPAAGGSCGRRRSAPVAERLTRLMSSTREHLTAASGNRGSEEDVREGRDADVDEVAPLKPLAPIVLQLPWRHKTVRAGGCPPPGNTRPAERQTKYLSERWETIFLILGEAT